MKFEKNKKNSNLKNQNYLDYNFWEFLSLNKFL